MNIGEMYQQGDVILEKVERFPVGKEIKADERGFVLAEGEVSGHAHRIVSKDVQMIQTDDGRVFLRAKAPVKIQHEEHRIIIIEPGEYEVRKVLERDHFSRATREVID